MVDAASVLGLGHVFTANMTGNVVFLGFRLAGAGEVSVSASLCALTGFLAGATIGGRLGRREGSYRRGLGVVAGLLWCACVLGARLHAHRLGPVGVVVVLAAAMGMQNAMVRRLAVADMTTTVLTLTLTGLAADSPLAGGDSPRTGRRLASVASMLLGAALGAALLRMGAALPIGLAAAAATSAAVLAE